MLKKIQNARSTLRKSEQKVADTIIRDPESALRYSVQTLAAAAGVSDPTVIRFCQALGVDGFKDFI